jgi:hypothetical protein
LTSAAVSTQAAAVSVAGSTSGPAAALPTSGVTLCADAFFDAFADGHREVADVSAERTRDGLRPVCRKAEPVEPLSLPGVVVGSGVSAESEGVDVLVAGDGEEVEVSDGDGDGLDGAVDVVGDGLAVGDDVGEDEGAGIRVGMLDGDGHAGELALPEAPGEFEMPELFDAPLRP